MTQTILGDVAQYYGDKLRQHGATPACVDWKDESSQILRFEQLLRVVYDPRGSVIDFGCGFGALLGNMRGKGFVGDYPGIDIASDMIETAASKYATDRKARFETGSSPSTQAAMPLRAAFLMSACIMTKMLGKIMWVQRWST